VHYDGHTAADRIRQFLRQQTTTCLALLIQKAQSCGGVRSFHTPILHGSTMEHGCTADTCYTDFLDDAVPYIINEDNWDEDHLGCSYKYLVHYDTGTIECLKEEYDGDA
jgi:hypothetical protein